MENPTYAHNLKCLHDATKLRELMVQDMEQHGTAEDEDTRLLSILRGYIQELRFRAGLVEPYLDDLDRLATLKDILRQMNPIFDRMAELADGEPLQGAAFGLHKFLWQISIDFSWVIRAIESQHQEMKWFFDADRAYYAKSLEGEEALKAWIDEAEHA
jgi:hypothetical protein